MEEMTFQRIVWIDFIKGVLLFLICIGHLSEFPQWVIPIIKPTGMYYVPSFFVLSGFLYRGILPIGQYVRKKVRTLLIPYVFFSLLFIVVDWDTYMSHSLLNSLRRVFIDGLSAPKSPPLWFVLLLFTTSIFGSCFLRICNKIYGVFWGAVLLGIVAWLLSVYGIRLPLLIHLLPSATSFWLSGYIIARLQDSDYPRTRLVLLGIACLTMCFGKSDVGDMHFNIISSYPLFFVMPISCTYIVIQICCRFEGFLKRIAKLPVYVARNGIVVLATHVYFIILMEGSLKELNFGIDDSVSFFLKVIVVSLILFFCCIPFCNRYLYMLLGKQNTYK